MKNYKPWVLVDDDGSVTVELRLSPTKRFSIEIEPDGKYEYVYVTGDKIEGATGEGRSTTQER